MHPSITCTPAKLRDGSWGVRVEGIFGTFLADSEVTVVAKNGKTWTTRLAGFVWEKREGDRLTVLARTQSPAVSTPHRRADPVARRAASSTIASGCRACRSCGGPVQSFSNGAGAGLCHDCC